MRDAQNIAEIAALPIDYMGFIFYEKSARHVDTESSTFLKYTNFEKIQKVGVFVNESIDNIISKVIDYQLDVVQLHGNETNDFIKMLRSRGVPLRSLNVIFKSIPISEKNDFEKIHDYPDADFLLLDTKTPFHGGSGQKFDWNLLQEIDFPKPFFLSGGISIDDVEAINNLNINNLYGIDVNSKFEIEPAMKNVKILKKFIAKMI